MRSKSILLSATAIMVVLVLLESTLVANVNEGLISHWRFDEGSGNIAYDSVGTDDGTIYGATWTTGKIDAALSFDDVDDYIEVADDPSLRFTQYDSFSVSFWAKPSTGGYVFSKLNAYQQSGIFGYALRWLSDTYKFQFMTQKSGVQNVFVDTSNNSVLAGIWYFGTAVYDNKNMKIYLNAELKGTNFFGLDTGSTSPDNNFAIGVRLLPSTLEQYFGGIIDDVMIFDRALSAEEIKELYAPYSPGPIAHWKFDEGSGIIAYDSAGTNNGTIYGAAWTSGQVDGALNFNGDGDYVDCGNDSSLNVTDEITLMAWIKTDSKANDYEKIVMKSVAGMGDPWTLYGLDFDNGADNARKVRMFASNGYVGSYEFSASTTNIQNGIWYHVAGTFNGAEVRIYLNGVSEASTPTPFTQLGSNDEPVLIGIFHKDRLVNDFRGTIDEVAIYNRALSADEIRDIYVSYLTELLDVDIKPGSCPNLLNTKSRGVLPMAVLGSEDFDVISIDIASIRLVGVAPIRSSYEDVAAPVSDVNECACSTEGPDGFTDLTLKFETQMIVEAIGEVDHGDELVLQLTGVLSDETPIEGSDCVIIRGRHKPINKADFNGDGTVDMADFAAFAENWLQSSIVEH